MILFWQHFICLHKHELNQQHSSVTNNLFTDFSQFFMSFFLSERVRELGEHSNQIPNQKEITDWLMLTSISKVALSFVKIKYICPVVSYQIITATAWVITWRIWLFRWSSSDCPGHLRVERRLLGRLTRPMLDWWPLESYQSAVLTC